MKKNVFVVLLLVGLLFISGCQFNMKKTSISSNVEQSSNIVEVNTKDTIPTLFIHGYGGTANSFGGMIRRFENQKLAQKELIITVQSDNTIQLEGNLSRKKNNPMIQVLFADNKSNEWNQTEWIYSVLKYLKAQGVTQVNIVGHSMGGVSSLRFLTTHGEPDDIPQVAKLVAIGAPFNDFIDTSDQQSVEDVLQNGPTQKSNRYLDYESGVANIPTELSILLLAGMLDSKTFNDGTVPITSALAVYKLLKDNGNSTVQEIFIGSNAQHSRLHENTGVDQRISQFLWGK